MANPLSERKTPGRKKYNSLVMALVKSAHWVNHAGRLNHCAAKINVDSRIPMKDLRTSDFQIVPISDKYIESYYECLDAVARERRYLAFVQAPPRESVRQYVLSNIEKEIPQFVALSEDEVIGWCDITPLRLAGFTHCGELGMGVRDGFRRVGIGTKLVEQTLQKAKEQGIERVELEVFGTNIPAIRLYEKMGFVVEGEKQKARKLDGVYDYLILMAKFI